MSLIKHRKGGHAPTTAPWLPRTPRNQQTLRVSPVALRAGDSRGVCLHRGCLQAGAAAGRGRGE